jgi:hypothetical protein
MHIKNIEPHNISTINGLLFQQTPEDIFSKRIEEAAKKREEEERKKAEEEEQGEIDDASEEIN